ncbi:hypothetical protein [Rhodococcus spongiicola]|uniref:Uncharacterized protein n=1 Tax=Rhodococcus spongiicola TaxID=2487352 RepID=A0A438B5H2_9NOCA|nr:hypothetical protein [Rhodococcus spongiicola]RVW05988.1 hypothetical protein EF834_00440 [Rhodococcus spongiicola]
MSGVWGIISYVNEIDNHKDPSREPVHQSSGGAEGAGDLAVVVSSDGVLVSGDPDHVSGYVDRMRAAVKGAVSVAGADRRSLADIGALAAGVAAIAAQAGDFVRLSPDSMKLLREYNILPGSDGFNLMSVIDDSGIFRGQLRWQTVPLEPTQLLGVQVAMATAALRTAVASVEQAIEHVQGSVDKILALAEASRIGDVLGHYSSLEHIVSTFEETGSLPAVDWESVASLGPQLEVGIERLRNHAKRTIEGFDSSQSVQDRAAHIGRAVEDDRLGETLKLLVVAEESHYLWQSLRIERARRTEPEHLETVVNSARALLARDLERDGELLAHARAELAAYAALRPLEVLRWMSASKVKQDMVRLRDDLDEFALARRAQVTEWVEHEDPTIEDALAELGSRAKAVGMFVGGAAKAIGGKAIDVGSAGIGMVGSGWQRTVGVRIERSRRDSGDET